MRPPPVYGVLDVVSIILRGRNREKLANKTRVRWDEPDGEYETMGTIRRRDEYVGKRRHEVRGSLTVFGTARRFEIGCDEYDVDEQYGGEDAGGEYDSE